MSDEYVYIPMYLHEYPKIIFMSEKLNTRPEFVVGCYQRVAVYIKRHAMIDGKIRGVTLDALGRSIGLPGFPELLAQVGWLRVDETDPDWPVITWCPNG